MGKWGRFGEWMYGQVGEYINGCRMELCVFLLNMRMCIFPFIIKHTSCKLGLPCTTIYLTNCLILE